MQSGNKDAASKSLKTRETANLRPTPVSCQVNKREV
jgi:hypothetical protein